MEMRSCDRDPSEETKLREWKVDGAGSRTCSVRSFVVDAVISYDPTTGEAVSMKNICKVRNCTR
jgi:hypothetical protein